MVFVGFDIVDLAEHLRMAVAAGETAMVPKQGAMKGVQYFISTKSGRSRHIRRPIRTQLKGLTVLMHRQM